MTKIIFYIHRTQESNMDFQFTVVELPAIKIAGITVATDMANAAKDCPALWENFGPRICGELSSCADIAKTGESYGISKMIDENRFIYWAAVPVNTIDSLPADFDSMTIAAGYYVKGIAPNLEQLGQAFTAMYMQWPATQQEYQLDMQGICFELYRGDWQPSDPIEIYASLINR